MPPPDSARQDLRAVSQKHHASFARRSQEADSESLRRAICCPPRLQETDVDLFDVGWRESARAPLQAMHRPAAQRYSSASPPGQIRFRAGRAHTRGSGDNLAAKSFPSEWSASGSAL